MTQELVACVVGLSKNYKEAFSTRPGIGKSCLCYRLVYPGYDGYVNDHPSIFALHEFDSQVINCNHFLYWGSPVKSYPVKGGEVNVRFHIIEHTVLYHDVTSLPFNHSTKPGQVENYIKRITGPMESLGKLSYHSRDELAYESTGYKKQDYPKGITKISRVFVVVFDASLSGNDLEVQCNRLEPILQYLSKHKKKFIIVVTKRDCSVKSSLEKAYELRKNYRIHLVECSSSENLNTEEVLRILAQMTTKKKVSSSLSNHVVHYHDAAQHTLSNRGAAKCSFVLFVQKKVTDYDERLSSIQLTEQYKEIMQCLGAHRTGYIFAQHVLELYNLKVNSYAGVMENPLLRQEYLDDFACHRSDLSEWITELRKWISNHTKELPEQESLDPAEPIDDLHQTDSIETPAEHDRPAGYTHPTKLAQEMEGYLIFEPVSKVARDALQQERAPSLETAQDGVEFPAVTTGTQQHGDSIQEDETQAETDASADDWDLVSDYSSASELEDLSDHEYLNVDRTIICTRSDTLTDDALTSPEVKHEASQVADSPFQGEENPNEIMKSALDHDYENLIDYLPEASEVAAQNLPPVVSAACVSEKIDGVQIGVKDQDMEDEMRSTEDVREDTTMPERKGKKEVAADGVSQSHSCSTQNQVGPMATHGSSPTPKVLPKPKCKKKQVCPRPTSSEITLHNFSSKGNPPTLEHMLSSSCALSKSLGQLPPKIRPTVSRPHGMINRVKDLEKVIKSGSAFSIASEINEQTDAVDDSGDSTTVNGARGISSHGERDSSSPSSSSNPYRKVNKPPPKMVPPKFTPSAGAEHPGASPTLSAKCKENVVERKNTEQFVESKEKEVRSRAITVTTSPTSYKNRPRPPTSDKNRPRSPTSNGNRPRPPTSDENRPRLNQIRNKIAQRRTVSMHGNERATVSLDLQAMNKEERLNLAGIRKKLTDHKPIPRETLGAENDKDPPQHGAASELSISSRKKAVESKGKEIGSEVAPVLVIGPPVSPPPNGKLDLPPLPPKPLAKTAVTTTTRNEKKDRSAYLGGVGAGGLGKEGVEEKDDGSEFSSSPPPIPDRTVAMFEMQQPPPVSGKVNAYLNVFLDDASDTSISTATTPSVKPKETAKSTTKKKISTYSTKLKKEEVNQDSKKNKTIKERKEQAPPAKKSSFMRFPTKKAGRDNLRQKNESQMVESREKVVTLERPLPEIPDFVPNHTAEDYEKFAFDIEGVNYVNQQQLPDAVMAKGKKMERSKSQELMESKTALSIPATMVKSKTLSRGENASKPLPTRQTSTECPDYIDGYVNANNLLVRRDAATSSLSPQHLLPISSEVKSDAVNSDNEDEELHYDYPDLRMMEAAFAMTTKLERLRKMREASSSNRPGAASSTSNSHGTGRVDMRSGMGGGISANRVGREKVLDEDASDENDDFSSGYVPMASVVDDSYINFDSFPSAISDFELPSRTVHRSTSDHNKVTGEGTSGKEEEDEAYQVYMNLPTPDHSIQLPIQHSPSPRILQTGCSNVPPLMPKPSKIRSGSVATTATHQLVSGHTGAQSHVNTNWAEGSKRTGDQPP